MPFKRNIDNHNIAEWNNMLQKSTTDNFSLV